MSDHSLVWEKGRQLKKYDNITYSYNASGIRTAKTVEGVTHSYRLEGNKVLSEMWGSNTLTPFYHNEDGVCGIIFNGAAYYFMKNLQGDVISIKDPQGRSVAEYVYDAWGVCSIVSDSTEEGIADINPYRYRGYYYDVESGLYYVSSRYYDPEIGKWISPEPNVFSGEFDETAGLLGYNVYAYCANSPINFLDDTGESITAILIGIGIGALVGASAGSGAVLWSGKAQGMDKIAMTFAKKNGLKVLENTMRGRLLNVLSKKLSWEVMEDLWK